MNDQDDIFWKSLLAQSAPAFAGDPAPPFGFATRVLAAVREEQQKAVLWDRMGRRAILAALGAVAAIAVFSFTWQSHDDVDPAVKSLALMEDVPLQ